MRSWLRNLSALDWTLIHFKFALGLLWPIVTLTQIPFGIELTLQMIIIYVWFGLTILGAALCIVGIAMYAQAGTKWMPLGAAVELAGLVLMLLGPLIFTMVYVYLMVFVPGAGIKPTLPGLGWALCASIFVRLATVWPRYHWEATDDSKQV